MFGFIIAIAILWPPPIALHFNAPAVQEYTITSNFSFKSEAACNEEAAEFLQYVHESTKAAQLAVSVDCYAAGVVDL
jgi:hypothetical protein